MLYIVKGVDDLQGTPDNKMKILEEAVDKYGSMLLRISVNLLGSLQDAEDAVQETYLQYLRHRPDFADEYHETAWFVRVCINISKNIRKSRSYREYSPIDELENFLPSPDERKLELWRSVMALPEKQRIVIYLHYMEGMSCERVASVLGISSAAARKRLQKGRELLRLELSE